MPNLMTQLRGSAKELKCLGGKLERRLWWVRLYMFKGAGTREYFDYVSIYVSSCLGAKMVVLHFFYLGCSLSLICDI